MQRALVFCISMLAISGSAAADDAAVPLAAAVVAVKTPSKAPAAAAARAASRPSGAPATTPPAAAARAVRSAKHSEAQAEASSTPEGETPAAKPQGDVQMSGMSVLGNDDSPKSLALVPWKTSQLGDAPSLSKLLDDSTQPVDKDVFMRELAYYEIKTDSK
jgi:hypothetical protein